MLVSEFIVDFLKSQKVKHVFLITGGAIAFLVDKIGTTKDIHYVCMHHEQSAAMAADAYSRMGPGIGVAMATSGPGATNLITGICCSWFDSIPTLLITGQVNTNEQSDKLKVRQLGFQETKIVDIVKPVTKFAAALGKPQNIRFLLEKAVYIAKSGRPGPALVDIPVNLQYAEINPNKLKGFVPSQKKLVKETSRTLRAKVRVTMDLIKNSSRPIILAGFGNHISCCENEIKNFVEVTGIPTVTTWSAADLFPFNHSLLVGQSGVYGSRAANFAIQNADLLIAVGARLDTRQTANPASYAREAKKVVVDIDEAELHKGRGLTPDIAINCDAKQFLTVMLSQKRKIKTADINNWKKQIKSWKQKYPILKEEYFKETGHVNPYVFIKVLSDLLPKDAIIIPDEGGNLTWTMQAIQIKSGQRLFSAFGNSPMGFALPASIGASFATSRKKPIICITGDGGLQLNIQEFQTIVQHKLPIKIIILNNRSYGIIKQFQDTWLGSRYEASEKGYSTPNFVKVANAYGLKTIQIKNHKEIKSRLKKVLGSKNAVFCDVQLSPEQKIVPKLEFGRPLEDLSPLLAKREFLKNMVAKPLAQSLESRK